MDAEAVTIASDGTRGAKDLAADVAIAVVDRDHEGIAGGQVRGVAAQITAHRQHAEDRRGDIFAPRIGDLGGGGVAAEILHGVREGLGASAVAVFDDGSRGANHGAAQVPVAVVRGGDRR